MAVIDKFWKWINKTDSCWEWQGVVSKVTGYGHHGYRRNGKSTSTTAHRAIYEVLVGEIPKGYQIDHLCSNRSCVNPEHLEAVTPRENSMRAATSPSAINANKIACKNEHAYTEDNLYIDPRGKRECRICRRAAMRSFVLRRRIATWL